MYRADAQGFVANANGSGKNGYGNGNAITGVAATILDAAHVNEIQEELANVVEVIGGTALQKGMSNQVQKSIVGILNEFLMNNIPATTLSTTPAFGNGTTPVGMYYPHPLSQFGYTAVGANSGNTANAVYYSKDGVTWTAATTVPAGGTSFLQGICYNPTADLYVATGRSGITGGVVTAPGGATNTTWTGRLCGAAGNALGDVVWSPTLALYVTCVTAGANATYYTSPDGTTWTLRTISGATAGTIKKLVWTGGALIAVVYNASTFVSEIWRSTNGTSWTNVVPSASLPSGGSNQPISAAASDGAGVVVVGFYTNTSPFADKYYVYRSADDGVTWSPILQPVAPTFNARPGLGSFSFAQLRYYSGFWVALTNDNYPLSSIDGYGWNLHPQVPTTANGLVMGPRALFVGPSLLYGMPSNRLST